MPTQQFMITTAVVDQVVLVSHSGPVMPMRASRSLTRPAFIKKNVRQVAKHFRHLKISRLQDVVVDCIEGVADKMGVDLAFQCLALGLIALLDGEGLFLEIPLNLLPLLVQGIHHVVVLLRQLPQLVGALHRDLPFLISPLDLLHGLADGLDGPQDPAHHPLPDQAAGGQQEDVDADGPVIQPVHIAAQIAGVDADVGGPAEIGQGLFQVHRGAAGVVFRRRMVMPVPVGVVEDPSSSVR